MTALRGITLITSGSRRSEPTVANVVSGAAPDHLFTQESHDRGGHITRVMAQASRRGSSVVRCALNRDLLPGYSLATFDHSDESTFSPQNGALLDMQYQILTRDDGAWAPSRLRTRCGPIHRPTASHQFRSRRERLPPNLTLHRCPEHRHELMCGGWRAKVAGPWSYF